MSTIAAPTEPRSAGEVGPGPHDERNGWIMRVELTDAQPVMMSAAAQRKERCSSTPATIKGAALIKVGTKLAKLRCPRD